MTALVWDQTGERRYQTGVDRGVLYLHDGTVAPWNGLVNIEESPEIERKSFYLDGVKFLENLSPADFQGKLSAFTYPDEFDLVNGLAIPAPGLTYYEQPPKSFNLSYRTRIGNDVEGVELGYKIHILYNIFATPDPYAFGTIKADALEPTEFGWMLTGTPPKIDRLRPTVHISIDSTKTPPDILKLLEDTIYGTSTTDPRLPTIGEIATLFGYLGALIIVDHGDGSWSAIDEGNSYITMLDETTFQIDNANATYSDPDTYEISTTNPE